MSPARTAFPDAPVPPAPAAAPRPPAGPDTGSDTGPDAGFDAGPDTGFDAGSGRPSRPGRTAPARADRTGPPEAERLASEEEVARWQEMEERRSRFERRMNLEMSRLGLSPSAYLALEQLALSPGALPVSELARRIRLSPSSASRVVDRLTGDGLAVRTVGTDDRRNVFAGITARGHALYDAARPPYRRALALALDACLEHPAT